MEMPNKSVIWIAVYAASRLGFGVAVFQSTKSRLGSIAGDQMQLPKVCSRCNAAVAFINRSSNGLCSFARRAQCVYHWVSGKSKPCAGQLQIISAARKMGKKAVAAKLAEGKAESV